MYVCSVFLWSAIAFQQTNDSYLLFCSLFLYIDMHTKYIDISIVTYRTLGNIRTRQHSK